MVNGCGVEAVHAKRKQKCKQKRGGGGNAPAAAGKFGQRRTQKNGEEGQAIGANEAGGLQQRRYQAPAIARQVPGKTRQQMAAQPFAQGKEDRKNENARRTVLPEPG